MPSRITHKREQNFLTEMRAAILVVAILGLCHAAPAFLPPPAAEAAPPDGRPPLVFEPSRLLRPVYDLFLFHSELDMLEMRLLELRGLVDRFVLLEQPLTSSGAPKPMHYRLNAARFAAFPIVAVNATVPSDITHSWAREHASRVLLLDAARALAPLDALLLLSDVDEVPSRRSVRALKHAAAMPSDAFVHLEMPMFYYSFRWRMRDVDLSMSKAFLRSYLDTYPQPIEKLFFDLSTPHWVLRRAGWHCSYCAMSPDAIVAKIRAFAHQEFNRPPFTDVAYVQGCVAKGKDLFQRGLTFVCNHDRQDLPSAVTDLFFPTTAACFANQ